MIKKKAQVDYTEEWELCRADFTYFCRHYVKKPGNMCKRCPYKSGCVDGVEYSKPAESHAKINTCEFGKMDVARARIYNPYTDYRIPY